MNYQEILDYLKQFPDIWLDEVSQQGLILFKTSQLEKDKSSLYAVLEKDSQPPRLSLKCDQLLAERLRQDYETVLSAKNLNKKFWNTIICTGQVSDEDLKSLINLSFQLANSSDE